MNDMELAEEISKACTEARADMFVSWLLERLIQDPFTRPKVKQDAAIAIAALRSGPERPPSGEMVMVRRKVLADIEEGYRSRCEYCRGVKAACEELDVKYGIPCFAREAWCALSAAEAEGRKS